MASIGGGSSGSPRDSRQPDPSVDDLLRKLRLTEEEGEVVEWSDEEEGDEAVPEEFALFGKVLSPTPVHSTTILNAMEPAWGNPFGLKIRSVGDRERNLFMATFGHPHDRDRALGGSPRMIGKYAVVLQVYDARLKPSDICFDKMEMWVRILNLPLGWTNELRGRRAMELIGEVIRMDVDADGKASGPYLRPGWPWRLLNHCVEGLC